MPALTGATGWLNSPPVSPESLRGRVVVVNFCTYSCVNWIRTVPYVRAWHEKYREHGAVVLGVHTPEFEFETDVENIRRALAHMRVAHPMALDSDYAVWEAFANHYWPALYFVDPQGRIRHHQFGEGEYEQAERVIQRLLAEAGATEVGDDLVAVEPAGAEVAADWENLRSPETYVGYARSEGFASPGGAAGYERRAYAAPDRLRLNEWSLAGSWTIGRQAIDLHEPSGRIAHRFHARDVNLVMGAPAVGASVPFRVLVDGQAPGASHGADADDQGRGVVEGPRLYQLVREPGTIEDRTFEIEFLNAGVQAFVFTFG
jgi:thiol-disulfide isomerase/thioredoxin